MSSLDSFLGVLIQPARDARAKSVRVNTRWISGPDWPRFLPSLHLDAAVGSTLARDESVLGWLGIGQWAFFLGIPGLLVAALVIMAREPGWWSRVEEKYRHFQTQSDLYRERWTTRATNRLGENRVNKLYVVILVSFIATVIQGYTVWGFGPERNGREVLVPAAITTLLAVPAYVCVLILDFSAFGKRITRPLLISWIVIPLAWIASVLIKSFDETEGSPTAPEGIPSAVVLVVLAIVFFWCRRVLRGRFLQQHNGE